VTCSGGGGEGAYEEEMGEHRGNEQSPIRRKKCMSRTVLDPMTRGAFRLQKICNSDTVALSFVFDKFYLIMD
jgi:hypothetical protein